MKSQTEDDLPVVGTGVLENGNGFYLVPSESDPTRYYMVEQHPAHLGCTCKDHFYRGGVANTSPQWSPIRRGSNTSRHRRRWRRRAFSAG